jgi:hypothetical protein
MNVWVIFVSINENRFPNFFPIGVYSTEKKAKEQLEKLPKDNNYQLFKFPVDEFFGYFNKNRELIGMDRVNHWHFDYKDELKK